MITEQELDKMIEDRRLICNNSNLDMKIRRQADTEIQILRKVKQ